MTSTPPLLMLAQGRKPRLRKAVVPRPRELALHMAVAKLLREWCREDWRYTHIPSGELRDKRTSAKLKRMGLTSGWPDFVLLGPPKGLYALELKRRGENLTEEQEDFRLWCVAHGVPHVVADDSSQVLTAFVNWGCLRPEMIEALKGSVR